MKIKTVQIKRNLQKINKQIVRCSLPGDYLFPVAEACTGTCIFLRKPKTNNPWFILKLCLRYISWEKPHNLT